MILSCLHRLTLIISNVNLKHNLTYKKKLTPMSLNYYIHSFLKFEYQNISKIEIRTNFDFVSKFRIYKHI